MILETGRVIAVDDDVAWVETVRRSSCGACSGQDSCGPNLLDRFLAGRRTHVRVRLVGDEVAVVAVNSARPNPQPWRSSGRIPPSQLEALPGVLADERVRHRFVFLVTHYAPRLRSGLPDTWRHGLVNADALLDACRDVSPGVLLFGHVHWRYTVRVDGVKPRLFCAGSATKKDVEGLWVFDVEAGHARATPGRWEGDRYVLEPGEAIDTAE